MRAARHGGVRCRSLAEPLALPGPILGRSRPPPRRIAISFPATAARFACRTEGRILGASSRSLSRLRLLVARTGSHLDEGPRRPGRPALLGAVPRSDGAAPLAP